MKTKLIAAILAVALVSTAWADKKDDDYWQFEKWLQLVHQEAPRHHLKLQWGEPTQEEFFYLYCWQSKDHSIVHAIQKAKEAWRSKSTKRNEQRSWWVSYVCYVKGEPDSMGCAFVEAKTAKAARARFRKEYSLETCRITAVETTLNGCYDRAAAHARQR